MIELLGNLGDFIGGVAVLVTIGYLATQMRTMAIANRRATYQDLLNHQMQLNLAWMTNDSLAAVMVNTIAIDLEEMDPASRLKALTHMQMTLRQAENAYQQHLEKAISESQLHQLQGPIILLLAGPNGIAVWEQTKTNYPESFRNHVDGELIPQAVAVKASMDQFLVGPQP